MAAATVERGEKKSIIQEDHNNKQREKIKI